MTHSPTSESPSKRIPIAVTVAGSDSSGGAGVQADLKTFCALGVYGASVITALTAQNTQAVTAIYDVPPAFVAAQWDAVHADLQVDAVKIGMLSQAPIIGELARLLGRLAGTPVVLDPVMVAKGGAALLQPAAIATLREQLLPRATVLTPNLPEAAVLLDLPVSALLADPHEACIRLQALGPQAVVLKGGHASGATSDDFFFDGTKLQILPGQRIATRNTHGTGCTFSAAIAAALAHGLPVAEAVLAAKRFIQGAIAHADALHIGHGHGPVHHFFALWPDTPSDLVGADP